MAEKSREALGQEASDHPEGAERNGTGPGEAHGLAGRFDPFRDPYLADPYPFFARARAATPVFYSPDLGYWVVTRYHDIRHISKTPRRSPRPTPWRRSSRSALPQDGSWPKGAFGRSPR
jgi:cytochrome P450